MKILNIVSEWYICIKNRKDIMNFYFMYQKRSKYLGIIESSRLFFTFATKTAIIILGIHDKKCGLKLCDSMPSLGGVRLISGKAQFK